MLSFSAKIVFSIPSFDISISSFHLVELVEETVANSNMHHKAQESHLILLLACLRHSLLGLYSLEPFFKLCSACSFMTHNNIQSHHSSAVYFHNLNNLPSSIYSLTLAVPQIFSFCQPSVSFPEDHFLYQASSSPLQLSLGLQRSSQERHKKKVSQAEVRKPF